MRRLLFQDPREGETAILTVFQQMIAELEAKGWTVNKIAQKLDYQWLQIERVKNGGRVVYPLDFHLAALHTAECGDSILTIVPRTSAIEMRTT